MFARRGTFFLQMPYVSWTIGRISCGTPAWLGIVAVVVGGIWQMTAGGWAILIGLVSIVLGILLVRVYCEIIILLFRIYDSLRNIEGKGSGSLL